MDTPGVIEEVGVHAFADGGVAAHLGHRQVFHQSFRIGSDHIENGKVGQVDHADTIAQCQVFGVGDLPEVTVVPLGLTHGHLIPVFRQQRRFIGRITVGTLPSGYFHKVATQRHLPLIERTGAQAPGRGVGLPGMYRRGVDFLGNLVAAVANEFIGELDRVMTCGIHAVGIHAGATVGHPVRQHLARSWTVLDPNGLTQPETFHRGGFTDDGAAIGGHRQQAVKGSALLPGKLSQHRR